MTEPAVPAVPAASDLAGLLAEGERAAFHGAPQAAVTPLQSAVEAAGVAGEPAVAAAATWLLGVAHAAAGAYSAALAVLSPLSADDPARPAEVRLFTSLAGSTIASVHRQLGRHGVARDLDEAALRVADAVAGAGEARFDALLGLASDAVGHDDLDLAAAQLAAAEALLPAEPGEWWRQRVRATWVAAEVALQAGEPERAAALAADAVERAEAAGAPRHVAKGLLLLGLARLSAGEEGALEALQRAATLVDSLGTRPLAWRVHALLGAALGAESPAEATRHLAAARSAVLSLAGELPAGVRAEWLARPDVAALLGG